MTQPPPIGSSFTVARRAGVYREGDRWTITGHDWRGHYLATCPDRHGLTWTAHTLGTLEAVGILSRSAPVRAQPSGQTEMAF